MLLKSLAFKLSCCVLTFALALAVVELAAEQAPIKGNAASNAHSSQAMQATSPGELRQREGTAFEQIGYVQSTGDRMIFSTLNGQQQFIMLENLALDRVGRAVRDSTVKTRWNMTGTLTEYQGANYLLLMRAEMVQRGEE